MIAASLQPRRGPEFFSCELDVPARTITSIPPPNGIPLDYDTDTTPNDRLDKEPDLANELEARLDSWLTSHGVTLPQSGT